MLGLALSIYNESKRREGPSLEFAHPFSEEQRFSYCGDHTGPRGAPEKPSQSGSSDPEKGSKNTERPVHTFRLKI